MENTTRRSRFTQYFVDSFRELGKVTWPTKIQAINICILVVSFVFVAAIVFAGVDFIFNRGYTYLLELPINSSGAATAQPTGTGATAVPAGGSAQSTAGDAAAGIKVNGIDVSGVNADGVEATVTTPPITAEPVTVPPAK